MQMCNAKLDISVEIEIPSQSKAGAFSKSMALLYNPCHLAVSTSYQADNIPNFNKNDKLL